jgi:nucleoside-diphosphate-sugar epimerase
MIVGDGLIARALTDRRGVVFHAAGVSNSNCQDDDEFAKDIDALVASFKHPGVLVYFSTTSDAPTRYVTHKREAEELVRARGDYLICRLPIVAGISTNPHTLLNWLKAKIINGEQVPCWMKARRNVIDVQDVSALVSWLLHTRTGDETVNVAAPFDFPMPTIVDVMSKALRIKAKVVKVIGGTSQKLDTSRIQGAPLIWSDEYLRDTLLRYYA